VIQNAGHGIGIGGLVTIPVASAMRSHGYLRAFCSDE
jgi:hypothetical protein